MDARDIDPMIPKSLSEFIGQERFKGRIEPAMKDFKISITIDQGPKARMVTLYLRRFTVFATATRTERIPATFLSSFEVIEEMAPYSESEFAAMASRFARILGFELEEDTPLQETRSACVSPRGVLNRCVTSRTLRTPMEHPKELRPASRHEHCKSPYRDLGEVAAAYLYYLCKNHPFIDGNKRAALGACIVVLRLNGIKPRADGPEWEGLVLAIAEGTFDRDEATARLRKLLPKDD